MASAVGYPAPVPARLAVIRALVGRQLAGLGLRRALVAYSGGPDSTVLADAASAALGGAVILLHVDHGAAASTAARAHAVAWAAARGLELRVAGVTVGGGASWEAQARSARYRALVELAGTGELVLTAHTATDQAETVLLQLVRGTGPAGLAGVAVRRGPFLRPLLEVHRAEVLAYAAAAGLAPWRDPMNDDPRFTRTRIRHELVPLVRSLNPQVEASLCRLAAAAAEQRGFLDTAAGSLLRTAARGRGLACGPLAAAPTPVTKRALAMWLRGRRGVAAVHLEVLAALCRGPESGTRGVDLPGGRVERVYDELRLDGGAVRPAATTLDIHGPDGPYRVRSWQPGDRMRPARLRGRSRKLSDLYIDLRVPRADRATARVVTGPDGTIVWADHIGPAHGAVVEVRAITAP